MVPSVPGLLASSLGRIMIVFFVQSMPGGGTRQYGGSPCKGSWDGTRYVFRWNLNGKTYRVARLVCEAFHGPPPFPGAVCMHLDESARNNVRSNLKWGTQKDNLNAPGFIAYCKSRIGDERPVVKGTVKGQKS
jgi:hypothetical protein